MSVFPFVGVEVLEAFALALAASAALAFFVFVQLSSQATLQS